MDSHRFPSETEFILKFIDLVFQNLVFVIEIRYIGHHKVKLDIFLARTCGLLTNIANNINQTPQVLLIWKEQDNNRIR